MLHDESFVGSNPDERNTFFPQQNLQTIAVIAKAASEFAEIGIRPLNPDVFHEYDFISLEVPTTGSATM
jgi:hypothetical protein